MDGGGRAAVRQAAGPRDMEAARGLFREYADWLGVDLCFQGFEAELASLPGGYAPPAGGLWFALAEGAPAGVVGLRPLAEPGACEMKRLWVRPAFRGRGFGQRLAETAIAAARKAGYRTLYLDTLPAMASARALYDALGFHETAAYYENPLAGVVYLRLDLAAPRSDARLGAGRAP